MILYKCPKGKVIKNLEKNFLRNFKKPLDKKHKMCYNIDVKGRERKRKGAKTISNENKKNKKSFQKPLDKSPNL